MFCPRCKIKLKKAIFYNTEIDYCSQCLGVFFNEDELRQVKDTKDKELNWIDIDLWEDEKKFKISYGVRLCPSCRLPLYEVYYGDSKIVIDLCNLCQGIWLDRGEFKKVIEYLKEEANWEVLNKYNETLSKEFFEIFSGPESFREEVSDFLTLLKLLNYKFIIKHPAITKTISQLPK